MRGYCLIWRREAAQNYYMSCVSGETPAMFPSFPCGCWGEEILFRAGDGDREKEREEKLCTEDKGISDLTSFSKLHHITI